MSDARTTALRWGLLGTARINRRIIPAIRKTPGHELVAVASRDAARADAYARAWGIPKSLPSYESLLATSDLDIVYVPLPNSLHADWTIACLEAGKHVLCEKPLAVTVEDVDRIAATAQATGRIATEGFMYRHHAQTLEAVRLIRDGVIGRLRLVRGAFTFLLERDSDVRLVPALGGGSLWDVGCYPVSFARLVCGAEPVEVYGRAEAGPSGVDVAFRGQLTFPDDVAAQFDCGFRTVYRTSVEIGGTEGTLTIPQPFQPGVREHLVLRRGVNVTEIPIAGQPLFHDEVAELRRLVTHGGTPRVSLEDSRANVAAIQALYRSARERRPVTLP